MDATKKPGATKAKGICNLEYNIRAHRAYDIEGQKKACGNHIINVRREGFACTWTKKDLGQRNFDRLFSGNCYSNGIPIAVDTDAPCL